MRNPLLRNTPPWVMLFAICLPDVKDTDARNHEKATYYPDYAIYHDVDRYNREVEKLVHLYPTCVAVPDKGRSRLGDVLYLVKLTDISKATRADGSKKKRMLITFGEHAREFLPVESFFKLVHDTCKAFKAGEEETVHLMGNIELLLIGLVNPDGRRHLEKTKDWCWRGMANMVDVNRNCDWEWGGVGSSDSVKNEEYRGTHPFSEPETRFVRDVAIKWKIDAYMSMHTGAQFIFVPYSDTESKKRKRRHSTTEIQIQLSSSLWSAAAGFFSGLGIVYELNDYTADGTIADYIAGALQVPVSLTFELYGAPGDLPNCFEQFNPSSVKVEEILAQFHPIYPAAMRWLVETEGDRERKLAELSSAESWEVHVDVDADGGDLYHVELTTNMTERIRTLKLVCDALLTCRGFNSNGWLKTRVPPASQRRTTLGTILWVKKAVLKFPLPLAALPQFPSAFSPPASSPAEAAEQPKESAKELKLGAHLSNVAIGANTAATRARMPEHRTQDTADTTAELAAPARRVGVGEGGGAGGGVTRGGGGGSSASASAAAAIVETLEGAENEIASMRVRVMSIQHTLERLARGNAAHAAAAA